MVEDAGRVLGRHVRLQVGALVAEGAVAGGVSLAERVAAEPRQLAPHCPRGSLLDARARRAADEPFLERGALRVGSRGADRPSQLVDFVERNIRERRGDAHHVFLVEQHAVRAPQGGLEARMRIRRELDPAVPAAEGLLHARLGRPGSHEHHRGRGVLERARRQHADEMPHGG